MKQIYPAALLLFFLSASAAALTSSEKAQLNLGIDRAVAKTLTMETPHWASKTKPFRLLELEDEPVQAAILNRMEWPELMLLVRYRAESIASIAAQAVELDSNRSLSLPFLYAKTTRAFALVAARTWNEREWTDLAQEASAALRVMQSLKLKPVTKKAPLPPPMDDDSIGPALASIGVAEINWAMMGLGGANLYPFTFPRHENVPDSYAEVWIQQAYARAKLELNGALLRRAHELGVVRPVLALAQMQNPKGALVATPDIRERPTVCARLLRFFSRR